MKKSSTFIKDIIPLWKQHMFIILMILIKPFIKEVYIRNQEEGFSKNNEFFLSFKMIYGYYKN